MKTTIIDWKKWYSRATYPDLDEADYSASLTDEAGRKCCIGFYCRSFGIKNTALMDIGFPQDIDWGSVEIQKPKELVSVKGDSSFVERAININDDPKEQPHQIIINLLKLCAKHKINWEFKNVPKTVFAKIPEKYHDRVKVRK